MLVGHHKTDLLYRCWKRGFFLEINKKEKDKSSNSPRRGSSRQLYTAPQKKKSITSVLLIVSKNNCYLINVNRRMYGDNSFERQQGLSHEDRCFGKPKCVLYTISGFQGTQTFHGSSMNAASWTVIDRLYFSILKKRLYVDTEYPFLYERSTS